MDANPEYALNFRRHGGEPWRVIFRGSYPECVAYQENHARNWRSSDYWIARIARVELAVLPLEDRT